MIFFSVGLPGRFAECWDALTLRLAQRCLGDVSAGEFRTLDDIARAAIKADTLHLVAALRQPVVQLQTEIVQSGRPFLVTLGDVYAAVRELEQRSGYDRAVAVREIAGSCAALLTLAAAPAALVLADGNGKDPLELAAAIARHFRFPLDAETVAEVAAAMAIDPDGSSADGHETGDNVVRGALEPYVRFFRTGGELEPIVWEPDLFFATQHVDDGSRVSARGAIDITGRARFLIFGPYINLIPGPWVATVSLAFSAETAGMSFMIEITAGTQLAYTRVQPAGEQIIETSLPFTIPPSSSQPVEIRVISERAAFDGRIALGYVRLARRPADQSESEQRLIASLRR